jgi:hypothetical protein
MTTDHILLIGAAFIVGIAIVVWAVLLTRDRYDE